MQQNVNVFNTFSESGFVVLQGTTYWTDLFVRHFLFQEEQSIDCDDLLFFVRKRHMKGSSRYLPKYEVSVMRHCAQLTPGHTARTHLAVWYSRYVSSTPSYFTLFSIMFVYYLILRFVFVSVSITYQGFDIIFIIICLRYRVGRG